MELVSGNIFGFWLLIVASAVSLYIINLSRTGKFSVRLRRIAGLEAVEEAVGRATEMGKPFHFSPGLGDIIGTTAPETFAALHILSYVTSLSAKYDTRMIVTIRMPNVFPLAQQIVRESYSVNNKADMYREDTVRYISSDQDAYASGVIGLLYQEEMAANIMAGLYMGEALLIAESGSRVGAMQVAITASITQIPFFVAACDYTIIGEELFAAGAYVSGDKERLGAIAAQDYFKLAVMAVIILGTVVFSAGSNFVQLILTK